MEHGHASKRVCSVDDSVDTESLVSSMLAVDRYGTDDTVVASPYKFTPALNEYLKRSLFDILITNGPLTDVSAFAKHNLPTGAAATSIVGRQEILCQLIQFLSLAEPHFVRLIGLPGMGKTTTAFAAAKFLRLHGAFRDGIINVVFRDCESRSSVLGTLLDSLQQVINVPLIPDQTDEGVMKAVLSALKDKQLLLIISHSEFELMKPAAVLSVLKRMVTSLHGLRVLMCCLTPFKALGVAGVVETDLRIEPLTPEISLQLLKHLALSASSQSKSGNFGLSTLQPQHPIIKFLGGHPQAITLCANLLHTSSVAEVSERFSKGGLCGLMSGSRLYSPSAIPDMGTNSSPVNQLQPLTSTLQLCIQLLTTQSEDALKLFAVMGIMPDGIFELNDSLRTQMSKAMKEAFVRPSETSKTWPDSDPFDLNEMFDFLEDYENSMRLLKSLRLVQEAYRCSDFTVDCTLPFVTDYAYRYLLKHCPQLFRDFVPRLCKYLGLLCQWIECAITRTKLSKLARIVLRFQEQNVWCFLRLLLDIETISLTPLMLKSLQTIIQLFPRILNSRTFRTQNAAQAAQLGMCIWKKFDNHSEFCASAVYLARLMAKLKDHDNASQLVEQVLATAQAHQLPREHAKATALMGQILEARCQFDEALSRYQESEALYSQIQDMDGVLWQRRTMAALEWRRSHLDQAQALYTSVIEVSQHDGFPVHEMSALRDRAKINVQRGDHTSARQDLQLCVERSKQTNDQITESFALLALGNIDAWSNELEAASAKVETALRTFEEMGNLSGKANAKFSQGLIAYRSGFWQVARSCFMVAHTLFMELKDDFAVQKLKISIAACDREMGRLDEAMKLVEIALDKLTNAKCVRGQCLGLSVKASILCLQRKLNEAETIAQECLTLCLLCECRNELASTLTTLGDIYGQFVEQANEESRCNTCVELSLNFYSQARTESRYLGDSQRITSIDDKVTNVRQMFNMKLQALRGEEPLNMLNIGE
jgi:tetratricopeptide (TPR) repeat protein